jgi:hypothetical protein
MRVIQHISHILVLLHDRYKVLPQSVTAIAGGGPAIVAANDNVAGVTRVTSRETGVECIHQTHKSTDDARERADWWGERLQDVIGRCHDPHHVTRMKALVSTHGIDAALLGWSDTELFGIILTDSGQVACGLFVMAAVEGGQVVSICNESATVRRLDGTTYEVMHRACSYAVPLWEFDPEFEIKSDDDGFC